MIRFYRSGRNSLGIRLSQSGRNSRRTSGSLNIRPVVNGGRLRTRLFQYVSLVTKILFLFNEVLFITSFAGPLSALMERVNFQPPQAARAGTSGPLDPI